MEFVEQVYNLVGEIGDCLTNIESFQKQAHQKLVKLEEVIEAYVNKEESDT